MSATPAVVVIADDLTGAADAGVTFVRHGARVQVLWDMGRLGSADLPPVDAIAISTESRQCAADAAREAVRVALEGARPLIQASPRPWIYKKIDSTLRGHPGVELAAALDDLQAPRALVAPAFPVQGRTTCGGLHRVQGQLLAQTVFGREVGTSDLRAIFARGCPGKRLAALPLASVRRGPAAVAAALRSAPRIWIADAETDADLICLAQSALISDIEVLCGSAGLAGALASVLAEQGLWSRAVTAAPRRGSGGKGVLVVAASRHPQTVAQVALAARRGLAVVCPPPAWYTAPDPATVMPSLVASLDDGAAILTTVGLPDMPDQARHLTVCLAAVLHQVLERMRLAGLVLTGGATAIAVAHALGIVALRLGGEVMPGIPWGTLVGGTADGLPAVTKAGGFGGATALLDAVRFLTAPAARATPESQVHT